jgi:uncharacterized protein
MRAVLDTNIYVSGIHWTGSSEKILRAWMSGTFRNISSIPIIEEIIRVLMAFKVPLESSDISWWEGLILEKSTLVFPSEVIEIIKDDPDDDKFLEAAVEGSARYIVSQDKHILKLVQYRGMKMIHPDEFVKLL